jgi:hypothetical protein
VLGVVVVFAAAAAGEGGGCRRVGPDLGPTCPDLGSEFFFFLKTDFGYRLGTADTKNNLFFVS